MMYLDVAFHPTGFAFEFTFQENAPPQSSAGNPPSLSMMQESSGETLNHSNTSTVDILSFLSASILVIHLKQLIF
jgi:hypothetical protein